MGVWVDRSIGRSVGWLVGRLVGGLVGRSVGRLVARSVARSVCWLTLGHYIGLFFAYAFSVLNGLYSLCPRHTPTITVHHSCPPR